jgi:hypothetical protein
MAASGAFVVAWKRMLAVCDHCPPTTTLFRLVATKVDAKTIPANPKTHSGTSNSWAFFNEFS